MTDYDYIVSFDETGQPYIEHFSLQRSAVNVRNRVGSAYNAARAKAAGVQNYGVGRGVRQNHKYIAKIGNRYIYDAKELAAAKANQFKSAAKKTTANAGVKEAINLAKAKKESKNPRKVIQTKLSDSVKATTIHRKTDEERRRDWKNEDIAQEQFDKTLLGKGVKAAKNAVDTAEYEAKKGVRKIDNAYETAKLRARYLPRRIKYDINKKTEEVKTKTDDAIDSAKKKASETAENVKNKAKEKANGVADKAKNVANKVSDKAKDIAGVDERERRDVAMRDTVRAYNKTDGRPSLEYKQAVDREDAAQKAYDRTPLGMIDMAKDYANAGKYHANRVVNEAREKAKEKVKNMNVSATGNSIDIERKRKAARSKKKQK